MDDEPGSERNRDSLLLMADIFAKGASWPARVRNISAGGLMAEPCRDLAAGDSVAFDLRNVGRVGGKVAWVAEPRFGVAFDKPIDHQAVRGSIRLVPPRLTPGAGPPRRRV